MWSLGEHQPKTSLGQMGLSFLGMFPWGNLGPFALRNQRNMFSKGI